LANSSSLSLQIPHEAKPAQLDQLWSCGAAEKLESWSSC
jgi:hypothetical protein